MSHQQNFARGTNTLKLSFLGNTIEDDESSFHCVKNWHRSHLVGKLYAKPNPANCMLH